MDTRPDKTVMTFRPAGDKTRADQLDRSSEFRVRRPQDADAMPREQAKFAGRAERERIAADNDDPDLACLSHEAAFGKSAVLLFRDGAYACLPPLRSRSAVAPRVPAHDPACMALTSPGHSGSPIAAGDANAGRRNPARPARRRGR